jgi:hypothetical protein
MKQFAVLAALIVALGSIHLTRAAVADGKSLPSGTYMIRATDDEPKPAAGQSQNAERWVEFVKGGKVVGREVATIVSADDMKTMAKAGHPKANSSRVEMLKGGDYLRIWINRNSTNYLINLPVAK